MAIGRRPAAREKRTREMFFMADFVYLVVSRDEEALSVAEMFYAGDNFVLD